MAAAPALHFAVDVAAHAGVVAAARERHALAHTAERAAELKERYAATIDSAGPNGATALLVSCLQGIVADAAALLGLGADPAAEGEIPQSLDPTKTYRAFPLSAAARAGSVEIVRLLLTLDGVSADQATTDEGRTPLLMASGAGMEEVVKLLLAEDGVDVNRAKTDNGCTALFMACQEGYTEVVKLLLGQSGVEVNKATTDDGQTPLFKACQHSHTPIVRLLLARAEIDVNAGTSDGDWNPLFMACQSGHTEVVKLLLMHGAVAVDVPRTQFGWTPFFLACQEGHVEIVNLLLANEQVDVNVATADDGQTPLYGACVRNKPAIVRLLLATDAVDANKATSDDGTTPLYAACQNGCAEIVKLLLAVVGIDVNRATTDACQTPLYIACWNGRVEATRLLLAKDDVDVNKVTTDDGSSALQMACQEGHAGIVRLLLDHKSIDANKAKMDGATSFFTACTHNQQHVVKLLLAHGGIDTNKADSETGASPLIMSIVAGNGHQNATLRLLLADGRADLKLAARMGEFELTPQHTAVKIGNLGATQLLLAYGADMSALQLSGIPELATDHPALAEWLAATATWSRLRVITGCRLYREGAAMLRGGLLDPEQDVGATAGSRLSTVVKEMAAAVETSKTKPGALPWRNALPICKATTKFAVDAVRGWHRTTHWLHHKQVRHAVLTVILVADRAERGPASAAAALAGAAPLALQRPTDGSAPTADQSSGASAESNENATPPTTPLLPIEIWMYLLRFVQRSWWAVDES